MGEINLRACFRSVVFYDCEKCGVSETHDRSTGDRACYKCGAKVSPVWGYEIAVRLPETAIFGPGIKRERELQ